MDLVFLARAWVERKRGPALCLALLMWDPWLLGAAMVGPGAGGVTQLWLGQANLLAEPSPSCNGVCIARRFSAGGRLVGLWLGQLLLVGVLIVVREPWAVAVAVLLLAPPTWWLARRAEMEAGIARSLPWWWAAMLSGAMIVR